MPEDMASIPIVICPRLKELTSGKELSGVPDNVKTEIEASSVELDQLIESSKMEKTQLSTLSRDGKSCLLTQSASEAKHVIIANEEETKLNVSSLQHQVDHPIYELHHLQEQVLLLKEKSKEKNKIIDALIKKIQCLEDSSQKMEDHYQLEINTQTKLVEKYKKASEGKERRITKLQSKLKNNKQHLKKQGMLLKERSDVKNQIMNTLDKTIQRLKVFNQKMDKHHQCKENPPKKTKEKKGSTCRNNNSNNKFMLSKNQFVNIRKEERKNQTKKEVTVDIREYCIKDGKLQASKKGICLTRNGWCALQEHFININGAIEKL